MATEQAVPTQVEALTKILKLLAAEPDRDKFIGQVLKAIADQLGAHSGAFWFYDAQSETSYQHLEYRDGAILPAVPPQDLITNETGHSGLIRMGLGGEEPGCSRVLTVSEPRGNDPNRDRWHEYLLARGLHTLLLIPVFLEDEFLGSFRIHSLESRAYQPEEVELAQALAQQAVLAIQLARLAEQSRQSAVLEERNRISREIHDTLAQSFTGMLLQLGVALRIAKQQPEEAWSLVEHVRELGRQGLTEVRRSVWALQPEAMDFVDLASVLPRTVVQMTAETSIHGEVHIHGMPHPLPSDIGMNLLRIGQEALNNAIQHAHPHAILIDLTFSEEQVRLCIQDDGRGFDPRHQEDGGGFGLIGMRQRAERIGGQLTIASQPGRGTEVAATVPLVVRHCREEHQ